MAAVLDTKKFAENLRRLFALPTNVMHYAIIDQDRFRAIGDKLYAKVIVTAYWISGMDEPLKVAIIPPLAHFTCLLQEAASDHDKTMGCIVNALNTTLRQIPLTITLPPNDHTLLADIDCAGITDENQLLNLEIQLIASHKPTKWHSATDPIPLRALYTQTALNKLWAESKAEKGIQFRQWF